MCRLLIFSLFVTLSLGLSAVPGNFDFFHNEGQEQIFVQNRVLAMVEDTPITVLDIKKRLDYLFARQYPEYVTSNAARYEFYKATWRAALEEQIQKNLIKADAKEMHIEISPGDVRQTMEEQFGPDIMNNLEKAGVTYEEAAKVIEEDLLIEQVIGMRVHARAIRKVTPSLLREHYEKFIANPENIRPPLWQYRIITVRDENQERGKRWADTISSLVNEAQLPLEEIPSYLGQQETLSEETKITISDLFSQKDEELADAAKEVLMTLTEGSFSPVVEQSSRKEGKLVYRIYYLQEHSQGGVPTFQEAVPQLHRLALEDVVTKESVDYFSQLHDFFIIQILYDQKEEYTPFSLFVV